ncbi:hypothetical protein ACP2W0_08680 [Pseudobacillus badius]|uniref:hypothetical protein n=1 Tax=Bacillus badius TaxID=1455 RepID=UPI003CF4438F
MSERLRVFKTRKEQEQLALSSFSSFTSTKEAAAVSRWLDEEVIIAANKSLFQSP